MLFSLIVRGQKRYGPTLSVVLRVDLPRTSSQTGGTRNQGPHVPIWGSSNDQRRRDQNLLEEPTKRVPPAVNGWPHCPGSLPSVLGRSSIALPCDVAGPLPAGQRPCLVCLRFAHFPESGAQHTPHAT